MKVELLDVMENKFNYSLDIGEKILKQILLLNVIIILYFVMEMKILYIALRDI